MILRYCVRYTGDADSAEDLTQQTLLEAWQKSYRLYSNEVRDYWLLGIANNVCKRYLRSRGVAAARQVSLMPADESAEGDIADDFDLEAELERDDLASLLDRAMALLPPETREVLVEKYIEESPQAEVAEKLGLTEGAVEARLHRGKLALRKVLTTKLSDEAVAFGLFPPDDAGWAQTRIWCPGCGKQRLYAYFIPGCDLRLECPSCNANSPDRGALSRVRGSLQVINVDVEATLAGIKTARATWERSGQVIHDFVRNGIAGLTVRCVDCGGVVPVKMQLYNAPVNGDVRTDCPHCGRLNGFATIGGLAGSSPHAHDFYREHGRIRTLPIRQVEAAGGQLVSIVSMESLTSSSKLDVLIATETARLVGVRES